MTTASYDVARQYLERGWRIIPLRAGTKQPIDNDWQNKIINKEQLPAFFDRTEVNIGVVLGINGLIDIDLDAAEAILLAPYFLPKTGMVFGRKSKRRSHWLYTVTDPLKYKSYKDPDGSMLLEIRANGHQTMLPGSMHPTGEAVKWESQEEILEIEPRELIASCNLLASAVLLSKCWPDTGSRHLAALHLSGALLRAGWTLADIEQYVEAVCRVANDREVGDRLRTVRDTAKSFDEGERTTGWPSLGEVIGEQNAVRIRDWISAESDVKKFPLTDLGNAHRLVTYFGHNIRYSPQIGHWLIWDGRRWQEDTSETILQLATEAVRKIYEEAMYEPDSDRQTAIAKWAITSQNVSRLLAIPRIARSLRDVSIDSDALDRNPYLFNTPSGTLNLITGGLQPFDKDDYITRIAGCSYDASARCPQWLAFLLKIMNNNEEMVEFLQRSIGYALSADTSEHQAFILHGSGSNGKTVFLEVLREVMGEYARNAEFSTFLQKSADSTRTDIARLRGARFVTASESEEGRRIAPALIKSLTGGDLITARFLYQSEFEYRPSMHIFMATNHKPVVRDSSNGFWRRITLIPFTVTIPREQQDKSLAKRLIAEELPGILAWAVEGCRKWQHDGLKDPPGVIQARETYRQEMDVIGDFIAERCEMSPNARVMTSEMYRAYADWSTIHHERAITAQAFKSVLSSRGIQAKRVKSGMMFFGVKVTYPEFEED